MAAFTAVFVLTADEHCGNRVFENQLLLRDGLQDDGVFVEGTHVSRNLCAIEQMDSRVLAACQRNVEKRFLDVDDRHGFRKSTLSLHVQRPCRTVAT